MEGSSSAQPVPNAQTIVLNVLSPSTEEVPNKLTFTEIPVSTTIRALKERIRDAVPARPLLPRQRLIYQGKVLASDAASLEDVFGQETATDIRQQWIPSSIPQVHTYPHGGPPLHPNLHGALPTAQQGPGQPSPGFTSQTAVSNATPPNLNHGPAPPIPPQLQHVLNSQLAAMSQQLAAQLAAQGQQHMLQGSPFNHFHAQQWQQPPLPQPSFQQVVAQQQQIRAAAGQHGLAQNLPNNGTRGEQARQGPNNDPPFDPSNPGNVNTVVRENQGPNGESFRMVIQSTSISRPNSRVSQRPHSQSHTPQRSSTPINASQNAPTTTDTQTSLPPQTASSLATFHQRLSAIETSLAAGSPPPEGIFDQARLYLNNMAGQPSTLPPGLEAPLRMRLNNLATQARHLRANFNSLPSQAFANQQATHGIPQSDSLQAMPTFPITGLQLGQQPVPGYTGLNLAAQGAPPTGREPSASQGQAPPSGTPDIYLLSSPAGPHSLLISPAGWYAATLPPSIPAISQYHSPAVDQSGLSRTLLPDQAPVNAPSHQQTLSNLPNQSTVPSAPTQAAQTQAQQQQPQAQQQNHDQNQGRDLARFLLPLGGHLWLLIRLFGFVYFFTAGGGQRRAILLGICAFIVFIANTGAFRPLFRTLWEPVRRHVEGLVPLAAAGGGRDEGQQRPRRQQQRRQAQIGNNAGAASENEHEPTRATPTRRRQQHPQPHSPADLADRLLRERNEQSLFRRAERAVALFVASLVPGVGERHIAARDAAEARRLEAEREREVRAQREREEQEEREMEVQEAERVRRESVVGPPLSPRLAESSGHDAARTGADERVRERGDGGGQQRGPLVEV
ncbi:MAG: hypothetical protein LQ345_001407 [Seirophora villosa]|nr:MAG: hypothetical protein LQ345_001407 [Seirophora villosa]